MRAARVEQVLDVGGRRLLRRIVGRGDDAVAVLGQRRHDNETFRREEEASLVLGERPIHVHVGQYEALIVHGARKPDLGVIPNAAVHAIAADDPTRPDRLCDAIQNDVGFAAVRRDTHRGRFGRAHDVAAQRL